MIDNCITENTNLIILNGNNQPKFDTENTDKWHQMAEKISKETGVPQRLIYTEPYLFHLDNWYKINGLWYYYKSDGYDVHFINELLGVLISEHFDLETIKYQIAQLHTTNRIPEYGLLSKNFCNPNISYRDAWYYKLPLKRDLSVLEDIRRICSSDTEYKNLLLDLKKFFVRDFFTSQNDRNVNNFLFKETDSGIRLAPLYDYEHSFESYAINCYRNQIGELNLDNLETQDIIKTDPTFQELFNKLMNIKMAELLTQLEDEHKIVIKEEDKEYYKKRTDEVKKLLKNYNIVK